MKRLQKWIDKINRTENGFTIVTILFVISVAILFFVLGALTAILFEWRL